MQDYFDLRYKTGDGLELYARDYPGKTQGAKTQGGETQGGETQGGETQGREAPVILCLHGLTRNSADFDELAVHLSKNFRVLVPEQRGRGQSQWDPQPSNYQPGTYVADTLGMLEQLKIRNVIIVGTSMGGLMAMMMAAARRELVAGVVLNDIGPEVDPRGLTRIKGYVGKTAPVNNWEDAAATVKELNGIAFPDYEKTDWMRMAHQLYRENTAGIPELAYDPAISKPISADTAAAVPPDLWPLFESLRDIPTLALRGAHSDILSADCFAEMQRRLPDMSANEIPHRGHAPALNEATSIAAIDQFVEGIVGLQR
ncbi:alpha/beta hydrolase [Microbulbifer magnicolonia]|uniref:alpha/beta fold hydrolase n=1 Tax=Microbulbifer magnicolonia TaxID=3109744 RepID=UPI002B403AC4|nr:alpha/beta hydrolase [Microbulbifer sp. GG15]